MKPRFVFIHGNQSDHWSFAWTPWLKSELEKIGYETFFETMPDSVIARSKYWLPFMRDRIKVGKDDVLIGWSSGAIASMRYAEDHKIKGSILISPSYTDLDDDLERQSGYFDKPWNWEMIKINQEKIALVCSDDDPYIPQEQFEFIADHINPSKIEVHGAKHFIERQTLPEVINYIQQNY